MSMMNPSQKVFILFFSIMMFVISAYGQNFDTRGRISNSVYALEHNDTTHVRLYQYLRFTGKAKDWSNLTLNVAARVLTDTELDLADESRFRAYRLSLSGRNLFNNLLDFELGRQFLHPGLTLGSLDGLNLNFKFTSQLNWQVFGGVESHLFKAMKVYEPEQATVYGTNLKYRNIYGTDVQVAFLERKTKDATQWRLLGLNLGNYSLKSFNLQAQIHYDILNKRMHRIYAMGKFNAQKDLNFTAYFKMQHPQVFGDSFFQIFDFKKYRQFGLSGWYEFVENYAVSATYNLIQLEEGEGHRIIAAVSDRNGSVGFVYETGDLGEQTSFMINYGYEVYKNLIASLSIDYTKYRISETYSEESQMGNAARLTYNFSRHWRVDLEYQWLTNKFKNSDHRLLNHIYYIW
jgi:hypothetical protein